MRWFQWLTTLCCLIPSLACGQPNNQAQKFQPFHNSVHGGSGGGALTPDFRVMADGTIIPTIGGNNKTFARAGDVYYWNTPSTVLHVAENVPSEHAYAADRNAVTSNKQGVLLHPGMRNECSYSNKFNQWDLIGTPIVTTNAAFGPDGNMTAERVQLDDGEGIEISLFQNATQYASAWMTISLGIQANSGTPLIKLRVHDGDFNYWNFEGNVNNYTDGFPITSDWHLYEGWGKTPLPASGQLFYEITANGAADINIAFASLQFTGSSPIWDSHTLGHIPVYMADTGDTRETTGITYLSYTSPEVTGLISEYTVNQWFYFPFVDNENWGFGFSFFSAEDEPADVKARLGQDISNNVTARFGTVNDVSDTLHSFRTMARGRWARVTYRLKSGDNAVFMDGQKIFTNTDAVTPFQVDYFSPWQKNRSGVSSTSAENYTFPGGRTEVWKRALSDAEILQLGVQQKQSDALDDPVQYYFPTAGATDVVRFNAISGNLTSLVQNQTLETHGAMEYWVQGNNGLGRGSGLRGNFFKSNSYFEIPSLPSSYNIAQGQNFVFIIQELSPVNGGTGVLFDNSDEGTSGEGYFAFLGATTLDFYVYSGGIGHLSRFTHNGLFKGDNKFYTIRWVFDWTKESADLYYKEAGQPEVGPIATTRVLTPFNLLGNITVAGTNMRFGARSNAVPSNSFEGFIYQHAWAKGTTTYDATTKP